MTTFTRDRLTWLAYLVLAFFAYMLATMGPLMPFLRSELGLNYTVAGYHLSALALGMVLAGLTGDRAARRWGRRLVFWLGGAGMALGAVLLVTLRAEPLTIGSAFLMGLAGSFIGVMVPAILSDRHGARRAIALTESNVAASVASVGAPLLIGLGESTGLGWRSALIAGAVVWLVLLVVYRQTPIPSAELPLTQGVKRPLPRLFWAYWLVVLFGVAIEWCVGFWGADFLVNAAQLDKVSASTLMSLFFTAMVVGRVIGSRLTRSMESSRLLVGAVGVVLVGFPIFWLGQVAILNIIGLFISGLGIANLFPLTISVATGIDPQQSNTASARISLASGIAILVAPQVLGGLADQIGISGAFGVAGVLLLATAIIVVVAGRHAVAQPTTA